MNHPDPQFRKWFSRYDRVPVHEHGFVELLDVMGSDRDIEIAARCSYTGAEEEERLPEETRHLLRYMMRARHTSPFEMAELKFRISMPIFVARQWIRHRTANVNEFSGRYAEMPDLYYAPEAGRIRHQSTQNKQGSGDETVDSAEEEAGSYVEEQKQAREVYEARLAKGIAKETARINLPLSQYTVMVWKIDLHNLLHFLQLRTDPHAQQEIRDFALPMAKIVEDLFPMTWEAFVDYRRDAITLTRLEIEAISASRSLGDDIYSQAVGLGLKGRELAEFVNKLRKLGL